MDKMLIVSDIHCRSFYKPILNVKDTPIIFMGDYMDIDKHNPFQKMEEEK